MSQDFVSWYEASYRAVTGALVAVAGGDVARAQDAANEAFARALERWPHVSTMDSPAGWTVTVGTNVLRRQWRRERRERLLFRNSAGPAQHPSPTVPLALQGSWRAVMSLSERQRTALALRYVVDLPEKEVARLMGVSRGTVASTLSDARARLRQLIQEVDNE